MKDMIIKGTGNSRFLRSVSNFKSLYPTYDDFVNALVAGNLPVDLNGINEAGIQQIGTALNKANLLPDSIPAALGLKMGNPQVKDALNVLANIGNVHVWKRVQTYSEPVPEVPAGYTLGEVETDVILYAGSKSGARFMYSSDVTVSMSGVISIGTAQTISYSGSTNPSLYNDYLRGKFVTADTENNHPDYSTAKAQAIFYVPSDASLSWNANGNVIVSKYKSVTGYPYTPAIPAGVNVDYLTSTDRDAYPDQSAEGGEPEKPAHYTLADAVTVDVLSSSADYAATLYVCDLNSIIINNDGSINTTNFSTLTSGSNALTMAGDWTKFSPTKAYYITSNSSNVVFTDTIFTVSAETTLQYADRKYVLPGCRELIGHAKVEAIPPNTTITYLGQLGGGARIEVGSYVGTGAYGSSNPNSLTFGFKPEMVIVEGLDLSSSTKPFLILVYGTNGFQTIGGNSNSGVSVTWGGAALSWYNTTSSANQLNVSGKTYNYIAIS